MPHAYDEIIDFIAGGTSPRDLVGFRASEEAKARVDDLIRREKEKGLSVEERDELSHYLQLEHLMRLVKARAHQHLAGE
ncbi:MAG: hypothetical protein ACR2GR_05565 [Rhodothermales bacterium]